MTATHGGFAPVRDFTIGLFGGETVSPCRARERGDGRVPRYGG